ncbi:hypothetical protein Tco_0066178 [Tanacetum coccineum]|uniref:Uncharacterized protein n=1 Tax=Tanacetum coccineum TaxID=301880 RepID=A0ABQ4Z216_9ASTR
MACEIPLVTISNGGCSVQSSAPGDQRRARGKRDPKYDDDGTQEILRVSVRVHHVSKRKTSTDERVLHCVFARLTKVDRSACGESAKRASARAAGGNVKHIEAAGSANSELPREDLLCKLALDTSERASSSRAADQISLQNEKVSTARISVQRKIKVVRVVSTGHTPVRLTIAVTLVQQVA